MFKLAGTEQAYSIVIPRFDAKIIAASSEQSIRGIRHGAHRPDLVICDDIEDTGSVKTKEGRDSNFNWFTGEILPIGDRNTKYIVVGNLLHNDSITMRIKDKLDDFPVNTTHYMEVPIINEDGSYAWMGKYPTETEMNMQRKMAGDEKTWQREYMLKIVSDDSQIIKPEWIKYYDNLPEDTSDYRQTIVGVDLAVKTGQNNDYTAMITAHIFGNQENMKVYIQPNPINRRMDAPTTMEVIKEIYHSTYYNQRPRIFIEDVAFQYAMIQHLDKQGVDVNGFKVHGKDKGTRLNSTSHIVRTGQVLFPRTGAEDLIQQLVYFGVEKYDDLADAFSMVVAVAIQKDQFKVKLYDYSILG